MLNLDPRIDLDEVKAILLVDDELDGGRIGVLGTRIIRTAASQISARRSCGRFGLGASSISFW